jgi:uncharacterized membrane protein
MEPWSPLSSAGVIIRLTAGALWLLVLAGVAGIGGSSTGAFLWFVPAAAVWIVSVTRTASGAQRRAYGGLWFIASLFGPFSLLLLAVLFRSSPQAQAPVSARTTEVVDVSTDELQLRLTAVEDQMRSLQHEVESIRSALGGRAAPAPSPAPLRTTPAPARVRAPERDPFPTATARAAAAAPAATATPTRPPKPPRELDFAELFGARALAWAGGVVMLLGVVFFFILAVNNGWIGPGQRVACGSLASGIVFLAGLWLRRRFGETYASLAAVGVGIGGGYATLAAATALYDLISKPLALVIAAAIATAGLAVSLAWRAELIAALGLIGAIAAPALLATQGGLTATGTAFAAIVTAAAAAVGVRMRWRWLLTGAVVASAPQIATLILKADRLDGGAIALAIVFALLYLATGIAEQLAAKDEALEAFPAMFILGSIGLTWLAAVELFGPAGGTQAGTALLVAAAAYGSVAVGLWVRAQRELGTLLGVIALAAVAVGVADILSGSNVAYAFAAEGAVLAFAARKVREPRLQLAALGYLVLAAGHALAFDAPPDTLFETSRHPAEGAPALAAAAVAALLVMRMAQTAWHERQERGVLKVIAPAVDALRTHQRELRIATTAVAALLAIDAISLAVLELFEATGGSVVAAFHQGHVVVTALWSLAGLAAVVVATLRRAPTAGVLAFVWLGVTALKVAAYDGTHLGGWPYFVALITLASALLLAGYLRDVLDEPSTLSLETVIAVLTSIAFAVASLRPLHDKHDWGFALLAIGVVLGVFAASIFPRERLRDLCTLLWAPALGLGAVAAFLLVDGTWLTLVWAVAAAALAYLSVVARESRFQLASLAYLVLTAGAAFNESPPTHLVVAHSHPATGLVGLLLFSSAVGVFAWVTRERWRAVSLWIGGLVVVYAASLGILELSVHISTASLHTDFQRGHTGVSALWGVIGLGLLYIGLTRRRRTLRLGGFALFAVSLGKLFLYDLSQLSSITRALSFLAVGAVLLLAGFLTQKLTAQDGNGPPAYS